ncbi:hypothetical protein RMS29_001605 [Agrobacterium rosae]|uniref:Uncharacterized protein n=1 Tax=Agrobacterium rosae TaxID=1972867 RepID=A0ABU4VVT2_9HYPH|nr:hypothetical protein [Agrobacterium rosae]
MATVEELEQLGELIRLQVTLTPPDRDRRSIYFRPQAHRWLNETLPNITSFDPNDISPREQMYALLYMFLTGETLDEGDEFRLMRPIEQDVYELKSVDLRIFGWFYRPAIFIATAVDTMERVHKYEGLSNGYRDEVIRVRGATLLGPPAYLEGASISDVFSV